MVKRKNLLERFKQVKKIQFSTEQSLTNIHAFGQLETTSLEIDTDVHLKLEPDLVRFEIQRFLLNSWDLTWLTLFKNHPIPPLKVYIPSFGSSIEQCDTTKRADRV